MSQLQQMNGKPQSTKEIEELFHRQGYRLTPQRYLILRVLQEAKVHLSVEQVLERVQQEYPCVNLTTIYRTLALLEQLKLVRETYFSGEHLNYEVSTGKTHHHLVCRECRAITHLDEALQEELYDVVQRSYHYHALTLDVMSAGYCDACWESRATSPPHGRL